MTTYEAQILEDSHHRAKQHYVALQARIKERAQNKEVKDDKSTETQRIRDVHPT